jgi:autotransporter-associated beta strand protein
MTLTASVSSGLPVTFSLVSGPATLSGNTLTLTGPGTVTVRAEQAGGLNLPAAAPVERTFEVTKAAAAIELGGLNAVYDGSEINAVVTTTPADLPVVVTYNGQLSPPSAVGSYTVVATIDDPKYEGSATAVFVISAPRFTWTAATSGGNLSWSTPSNWSSATPPVSGSVPTVAFLTGQTIPAGTITADQNLENPLTFHLLELNGTGPASGSALVRLTGLPISLVPNNAGQPTILVNALGGAGLAYELACEIQSDAQLTIEGGGSAHLTISGPITGPGGLTMSALSTATLVGNQTFTGPTVVESGTLAVTGTLTGTASVTVGSGATLSNTGVIETPEVTVLSGGTLGGTGTIRGNLTVSGEVVVAGPGTWRVEGNVTNTGTIRLTNGARLEVTGSLDNRGVLDMLAASSSHSVGSMSNTGEIVTAQSFASATTGFDFDGTAARLRFNSREGHAFQLERSPDLSQGSWVGVGAPVSGTGGEITLTDSSPPTGSRFFYRIKVVPLNP